jgi:hypothetical protein
MIIFQFAALEQQPQTKDSNTIVGHQNNIIASHN